MDMPRENLDTVRAAVQRMGERLVALEQAISELTDGELVKLEQAVSRLADRKNGTSAPSPWRVLEGPRSEIPVRRRGKLEWVEICEFLRGTDWFPEFGHRLPEQYEE